MAEHTPRDKSENGATGVQPSIRRKTGHTHRTRATLGRL